MVLLCHLSNQLLYYIFGYVLITTHIGVMIICGCNLILCHFLIHIISIGGIAVWSITAHNEHAKGAFVHDE
jgi:hypothetical protein